MKGVVTTAGGAVIPIRVVPRASRNELKIEDDGTLKIRLQAPALEGKANKALLRFLAKQLALPARDLALLSGEKSRNKRILVKGRTGEEIVEMIEQ